MSKFLSSLALGLAALVYLGSPVIANADIKSSFNAFIQRDENAVLPPDEAFQLALNAVDAQTAVASFTVTPGHYLYRDRIKFELKDRPGQQLAIDLPKGDIKQDPTFGSTEVYHHDVQATVSLPASSQRAVTVLASYQGCSDKGLCYAPIHKTFTLSLPADAAAGSAQTINTAGNVQVSDGAADDSITSALKSGQLWLIVSLFFVAGILVSFTPCMLPMIPVLSGIIVGAGKHCEQAKQPGYRLHSFTLSLAYTLGMALCYTLAGVAAGLSGHLLSSSLQSPWILAASALVFVLLALAMFGCYELRLPSALQDRVVNASNRFRGGRLLGVFVMGAFSALILSPCVAPALVGALVYISQTRDVVLGATALFAMSMGMGVPLLLIGASAGAILPKTGPWMHSVRQFFGVVMLAVAIWVVSPVIPAWLQLGLWAVLLIVPAIYLRALDSLPPQASTATRLAKGVAVLLLVAGIAMLVGALSGAKSPLQPLAAFTASYSGNPQHSSLPFQRVHNVAELDKLVQAAAGNTVMLDFYADWCVSCKEMERFTFSDARVAAALKNVVLLQADVTGDSAEDKALLKRFGLFGPPGILFFSGAGTELASTRVIGYQSAEQFLKTLNRLPGSH